MKRLSLIVREFACYGFLRRWRYVWLGPLARRDFEVWSGSDRAARSAHLPIAHVLGQDLQSQIRVRFFIKFSTVLSLSCLLRVHVKIEWDCGFLLELTAEPIFRGIFEESRPFDMNRRRSLNWGARGLARRLTSAGVIRVLANPLEICAVLTGMVSRYFKAAIRAHVALAGVLSPSDLLEDDIKQVLCVSCDFS